MRLSTPKSRQAFTGLSNGNHTSGKVATVSNMAILAFPPCDCTSSIVWRSNCSVAESLLGKITSMRLLLAGVVSQML